MTPPLKKRKHARFPSRYPIDVTPNAWFYEERGHIKLIAELRTQTNGQPPVYLGTTHTAIPFRLLCRTVDRYRKYKARRKK